MRAELSKGDMSPLPRPSLPAQGGKVGAVTSNKLHTRLSGVWVRCSYVPGFLPVSKDKRELFSPRLPIRALWSWAHLADLQSNSVQAASRDGEGKAREGVGVGAFYHQGLPVMVGRSSS